MRSKTNGSVSHYDGAGYDHGWILFELVQKYGDIKFFSALKRLSNKQVDNVAQYLEVGLDNAKDEEGLKNRYPKTFGYLGLLPNCCKFIESCLFQD